MKARKLNTNFKLTNIDMNICCTDDFCTAESFFRVDLTVTLTGSSLNAKQDIQNWVKFLCGFCGFVPYLKKGLHFF